VSAIHHNENPVGLSHGHTIASLLPCVEGFERNDSINNVGSGMGVGPPLSMLALERPTLPQKRGKGGAATSGSLITKGGRHFCPSL